ncbi:MAG: hypothetical protein K6F84_07495, partial [Lachnospiraceae bacterium]|nr:hypothetical protein [Lachnospiraceae bacterium]
MEYVGLVLGIFGLAAFCELASMKTRIKALESQMSKTEGTDFYEARKNLLAAVKSYIGEKVIIDFKEDCADVDVIMYGNSKNGSNIIKDVDEDWILVCIDCAKMHKNKLIRLESVLRISGTETKESKSETPV